jgi:hypothetical protein
MLAAVLVCAIAVWVYWIGWPNWVAYRAGVRFEEMAKTLQAGPAQSLFKLLPKRGTLQYVQMFDARSTPVEIYPFQFKYAWYCVYLKPSETNVRYDPLFGPQKRWDEVRVYRLKPPPPDYRAQTADGAAKRIKLNTGAGSQEVDPDSSEQYLTDFYQIATGHATGDLGIEFELVHADAVDRAE